MKEAEIPPKYQEHHQVFLEKGAKRLLPTRVKDMEITLKDDAPEQLDCKVYPLSRKELEVLRESLNKDLAKGYTVAQKTVPMFGCFAKIDAA